MLLSDAGKPLEAHLGLKRIALLQLPEAAKALPAQAALVAPLLAGSTAHSSTHDHICASIMRAPLYLNERQSEKFVEEITPNLADGSSCEQLL